jgi:heat shock protein HslJ
MSSIAGAHERMKHMLRSKLALVSLSLLVLSACQDGSKVPFAPEPSDTPPPAKNAEPSTEPLGVVWEWVSTLTPVERIEVKNPERYTLRLQADGAAVFQFDCNRGGGRYEISENQITFGPLMSTRMACPPDSQDAVFMDQLSRITSYFVRDGKLFLEMPLDSGTMRFRPARNRN